MPVYRVYFLSADDHIEAVETIECADNVEAASKGDALLVAREQFASVEIWKGKELVRRSDRAKGDVK